MNPRQFALVTWATIAAVVLLARRDTRGSVVDVVKTALTPKLLVPAIGGLTWNAAVIYGLFRLGFWSVSLWWDTAVFVLLGSAGLVGRMIESKDYSRRFFVEAVLSTLGLTVLMGTIVSTYAFGVVAELLLVPWLVLLGGLLGLVRSSDEHRAVVKPVTFLVAITGVAMLSRAVAGAIVDYEGFLSVQMVQSLLLLFVLTAGFVPYVFALRVWMTYEVACVPLKLGPQKSKGVYWYAVAKMVRRFRLNLSLLQEFRTGQGNDLRFVATRQAVDEVLGRDA